MKRILSAIILLLWAGCFFHCSAEQLGLLECGSANCEAADCTQSDGGEEPDPDDNEPCGLCEFIVVGGAPTVTPLLVDDIFEDIGVDHGRIELRIAPVVLLPPTAAARGSCGAEENSLELCELLARSAVPVRGPTA